MVCRISPLHILFIKFLCLDFGRPHDLFSFLDWIVVLIGAFIGGILGLVIPVIANGVSLGVLASIFTLLVRSVQFCSFSMF